MVGPPAGSSAGGAPPMSCIAHVRHASHTSRHSTSTSSHLLKNRHGNTLEGLLLLFELLLLGGLVGIEPGGGLVDGIENGGLVILRNLVLDFVTLDGRLQGVAVVLKSVLGLDTVLVGIILSLVLLGLFNHAFNLVLGKTSLVVGNGDLVLLSGRLLKSRHIQDAVGINVEAHINLGLSTGHGRDAIEVELTQKVVVTSHGALSLEDLDQHTRLVISVGGEGLSLLGRNGGVTLDESGHDTSGSL